jgi:hypothetical protein
MTVQCEKINSSMYSINEWLRNVMADKLSKNESMALANVISNSFEGRLISRLGGFTITWETTLYSEATITIEG